MADDVADRRLVALRHLLRQRRPHHQLVERLGVERLRRLERRAAGVDDLAAQHRELAALAARRARGGPEEALGAGRPRRVGPDVERRRGRDLDGERAAPAGSSPPDVPSARARRRRRGCCAGGAPAPCSGAGASGRRARAGCRDRRRGRPAARRCRCGSASPPRSRRGTARCRSPSRRAASRARTDRSDGRWPGRARLLGRHRMAGAEHRARPGQVLLAAAAIRLGQAEVEDLGSTGGGDHHVRRLQVAVHDVVACASARPSAISRASWTVRSALGRPSRSMRSRSCPRPAPSRSSRRRRSRRCRRCGRSTGG